MSPYGLMNITKAGVQLAPRLYALSSPDKVLAVFHLRRDAVPAELATHLKELFNETVKAGRTYPQEQELDEDAFKAYYLAYDLFIGIVTSAQHSSPSPNGGLESQLSLEEARQGRSWTDSLGGMYYVKPNYPGRSSHICNAGFVVPTTQRGLRLGLALGRSYLYYAPRLGYRASVFNLVYENNVASIAIWRKLGFQEAGRIPRAGRLVKADGSGEELVDALLFYREFDAAEA